MSFAPVSLNNIESIDVVSGVGSVRYDPQNVGCIINVKKRSIPSGPGSGGGSNTQYSTFLGTQLDKGLSLTLLYSGWEGSGWREGNDESGNDLAVKFRYELTPGSKLYGDVSQYDVKSFTPCGLTPAQFAANPFQNTSKRDFWDGYHNSIDLGYLNTISDTQELRTH